MERIRIFDNKQFVGYVNQITPSFVRIHFPSSNLLNKYYQDGRGLHSGILGNYVLIEGEDFGFLAKIVEVALPEKERMSLTHEAFQKNDFHPVGRLEVLICFDYHTHLCKKGLSQFPPVGSKVYSCSNEFLSKLLRNFGQKVQSEDNTFINLAKLPSDGSSAINVSGQSLFSRHLAILGSTGGGKSWTVAKAVEEIMKRNGKAILIDATGEYHTLAERYSGQIDHVKFNSDQENGTFLHYHNLREPDLIAMFRPSGQAQLPKLQEAVKSLRLVSLIKNKKDKTANDQSVENFFGDANGNTILVKAGKARIKFLAAYKENPLVFDTACNFNIQALPRQILKECVNEFSNDENFGAENQNIATHCQTLISRILLTLNNREFQSVFGFDKEDQDGCIITKIETFIKDPHKNILIVDTHRVPTDNSARDILINALGRYLHGLAISEKLRSSPVIVILDEAHQFLNKRVKDEYSVEVELNSFERIAKECRKFGLFLVLATQMPRDIPLGVLSQMGTFIVHRIINQKDREAIEFACSDVNRNALSFLPVLSSGEALLTGVDFPMPIILQILPPACPPDSRTPDVFKTGSS